MARTPGAMAKYDRSLLIPLVFQTTIRSLTKLLDQLYLAIDSSHGYISNCVAQFLQVFDLMAEMYSHSQFNCQALRPRKLATKLLQYV